MSYVSDELKSLIVNDYCSQVQTVNTLCEKFKLSYPTILKILKEFNIPTYSKQQISSIGLNENIFSNIDNEIKAYFLGFFLADGCVYYDNKSARIIFGLKQEDSYIVETFHTLLNANTSIRIDKRDGFTSCVVTSNVMAKDLHFYGLDNPKCLRPLPIVRYDLINHLIRGFFDGDGCFTYRLSHPERNICNSYRGKVALITYEIIREDILNILKYILKIDNATIERANSQVFLEVINICRKDEIIKFYNFIYNNATIFLTRKKDKFEQFFRYNNMI